MSTYQCAMVLNCKNSSVLEQALALSILDDRGFDVKINGVKVESISQLVK